MNEKINNYRPEIRTLCERLQKAGFELLRGDNGEDRFKFDGDLNKFVRNLDACDEAHLYIRPAVGIAVPHNAPANTLCIFLVLGNEPGVIACDYTDHGLLNEVISAHYEAWSGCAQPETTWNERKAEDAAAANYEKTAEYRAMHPAMGKYPVTVLPHHILRSNTGHIVKGPAAEGMVAAASENFKQIAVAFNNTPHNHNSILRLERADAEMLVALLENLLKN